MSSVTAPSAAKVGPAPPAHGVIPSSGKRLPGIEGLRAVAAFSILALHTWLYGTSEPLDQYGLAGNVFSNLGLGVTLFFTLSGFLLYRPFAAAIARGTRLPEVGRYLRNRFLRIAPAYWVILLATALVLQTALLREPDGDLAVGALTDPLDLLKTALLVQNYEPGTFAIGIGPAWSLAVELVFYLVLPVLVLAAFRLARGVASRRGRVAILLAPPLALLCFGAAGKYVAGVVLAAPPDAGFEATWHAVVERGFLGQADLFCFGMVAAVIHTEVVDGRLRPPRAWRPLAFAGALAILVWAAKTFDEGQLSYKPQNTAVAFAAALVLATVTFPTANGRRFWLTRLLELRPVVFAGLISYSVFLWNEPVIRWLAEHGLTREGWSGFAWNLALMLVVVVTLSWLTYRFVELPALRRKRRDTRAMDQAQLEAAP